MVVCLDNFNVLSLCHDMKKTEKSLVYSKSLLYKQFAQSQFALRNTFKLKYYTLSLQFLN